jgi:geranylgeranyl pyrophosphate synthase
VGIDSFPSQLIQERMSEVLHSDYSGLNLIIDYLLQSSGKMLRPRLVYMSAQLYPHDPRKVIDISVAVELIHLASLLHDDVIDQADLRRGRESVNSRWGGALSKRSSYTFSNFRAILADDRLLAFWKAWFL